MKKLFLICLSILAGPLAMASLDPVKEAEDRLQPKAPALVEAARSRFDSRRARAALAFGRIQSPDGIDALLSLVQDNSKRVRKAALWSVGQLGWKAEFTLGREPELAEAVAKSLSNSDWRVRKVAAEAMGKIGLTRAPEYLLPLLKDSHEEVRAETLMALFRYRFVLRLRDSEGRAPALPEKTLAAMLQLSTDNDAMVRHNLVYGFARFKEPRALEVLLNLSGDQYEWTRYFATVALAKIAEPESWTAIAERLKDKSSNVRLAAVQASGALHKSDELLALGRDPDLHVRSAVVGELSKVETTPAEGFLKFLADPSSEVRAQAIVAWATRKKVESFKELADALKDENEYVRAAAVGASESLAPRREELLVLVRNDSSVVVQDALFAIDRNLSTSESYNRILAGLESERPNIRASAAGALAGRKEGSVLDVAWKAYLKNNTGPLAQVREALVEVFANDPSPRGTEVLRLMLNDPAFSVQTAAYQALVAKNVADLPKAPELPVTFSPYRTDRFMKNPIVTLYTSQGPIVIVCYAHHAPIHVANFVGLVREGFYDGKPWFRIVPNFVIQGGAPDEMGRASADYTLRAEINNIGYRRGTLGMPRADNFHSGDVELFVTHVPTPHLDGQYTVFGQVIAGWYALDHIQAGDRILRAVVRR